MFISQDLKSFLQLFFREEIVFIPLPLYSHILIGNCLSAPAAGGTSGAGVGGRARGGKGGSTSNIAAVSVRFVKLRAATFFRYAPGKEAKFGKDDFRSIVPRFRTENLQDLLWT
jgi:hypothetical protein